MNQLLILIILSFLFPSYYAIGDTVTTEHQDIPFDVCYGDYLNEEFQLSDFNGRISIFGLSASW